MAMKREMIGKPLTPKTVEVTCAKSRELATAIDEFFQPRSVGRRQFDNFIFSHGPSLPAQTLLVQTYLTDY